MTMPRMNVPGATHLVTRTTVNSLFLLVPSPVVNQIFEYCLAKAAKQFGIRLHAVSVASNHYHLVLTDPKGLLSEFMQELNASIASCLIEHYRTKFPDRRLDAVWTPSQSFSDQVLVNTAAIIKAIVYVLTNPVKDGLVRDYRKWPGFNTRPSHWLRGDRVTTRPDHHLKRTDKHITFRVVPPKQLGDDVDAVTATIEQHVREEQASLCREAAAEGRTFMGAKAVCAVDPFTAPTTQRPRGNMNPHVAAGGDTNALRTAIKALRTFRLAYREAWNRFKQGLSAVFPGGTLLMARRYHQPCEPLDAACWCQLATG